MKTRTLRDAFEGGIAEGEKQQQTEVSLRAIWALVAPKLTPPFNARIEGNMLQISYGQSNSPFEKVPSIIVTDLGNETFSVGGPQAAASTPMKAEDILWSIGRFYGLHNRG